MKISEVEVGVEYGALDGPGRRYGGGSDPRQVRVLEIVTVEEGQWSAHSSFRTGAKVVNRRRVKVEVLDHPAKSGYAWDQIAKAEKGAKLVIEARQLVGLWKDLKGPIAERIAKEQKRIEDERALEGRVRALGLGKPEHGKWTADVADWASTGQLRIQGKSLEQLLALAEKGKAAS